MLTLYSIAHFLVDLSCAVTILGKVTLNWQPEITILLYNLLAFAAQMPIGLIADRFGHPKIFAVAGCSLVFVSLLCPVPWLAVIFAGTGNALFHVGGGVYSLGFEDRITPLGIFVSPGAIGLYIGTVYRAAIPPYIPCAALAVISVLIALWRSDPQVVSPKPQAETVTPPAAGTVIAVLCLVSVVIIRSFAGLAGTFEWKAEYGLAAVCAVAAGKAVGGIVADRFGVFPTATLSLGLSAVCFLFGETMPLGLAALLLFNMTMPLTLYACARLLPELKGFSFGLLTFALFIGFLPVYFGAAKTGTVGLSLCAAVSLPLLAFGLKGVRYDR